MNKINKCEKSLEVNTLDTISKDYNFDCTAVSNESCSIVSGAINSSTSYLFNVVYYNIAGQKNLETVNNKFDSIGIEMFNKDNIFCILIFNETCSNKKKKGFKRKFLSNYTETYYYVSTILSVMKFIASKNIRQTNIYTEDN